MSLRKAAAIRILTSAHFHGAIKNRAIALSFDESLDWGEEILISALNEARLKVAFFWTMAKNRGAAT